MTDDKSTMHRLLDQRKLETFYENKRLFKQKPTINISSHYYKYYSEKSSYHIHDETSCGGVENISIIVQKRKQNKHKKRKKMKIYKYTREQLRLCSRFSKNMTIESRYHSMPEFDKHSKQNKLIVKGSNLTKTKSFHPYDKKYVINVVSECRITDNQTHFNNPFQQAKWNIYRCQLNTQEESCCCSCNSDAMFEVMKSLYDCYKKKNCDHCDCILCGHLPREERRMGEMRKSSIGVETASAKEKKKERAKKTKEAMAAMVGKTPVEKEKILKDLAMSGILLPQPKTVSEKELINKVRKELGLPPEAKTATEKKKYKQAEVAGLIIPLEGKNTDQKEKILRQQAEFGITLPEGRTASEKSMIQKVKATAAIPLSKVTSEKMRKAKAAGLITPLEGKTPDQKEKLLRGLATHGIPFPEGITQSEKKLMAKVRNDLGLPPEPKTTLEKERYNKALAAGIITPLEDKTPVQKENILKIQAEMGIPLPEGRTPSEKAMIANIKANTKALPSISLPSEKLRKAKAAGYLTPLEGKTPEQKEKILQGLAKHGIQFPEGKTPSEKKLINRVRNDLGLPSEPKTESQKAKFKKAMAAGVITSLEGKSPVQKENILRKQADIGITLPEGRTPSEKAMIANIKATTKTLPSVAALSEKLRKAKAAGLLTPLEGKTPEQKEKILRGLATHGIPLPEGKSPSEKKITDKVRDDLGLPPEPKTASDKEKYKKALADGLITPLEGKSPAQKEKILRGQTGLGLSLPEGRTPSEKDLITKIKATARPPSAFVVPSERLRKAKAAGLITPLKGKTPEQKEKILRGLAMHGIPLPEEKSLSEKKIIDKVRNDLGLPPKPKTPSVKEKYNKAMAAGIITPLEGKTPLQKEKILKAQADMSLPLPEGRTPSEKALIAKIRATARPPSTAVPSEKLRKAKAAGLLTPLEGKTPEQKEKILRGLAQHGIPLTIGITPSDKILIDNIRRDLGLPSEPKTASAKEKYNKAIATGLITPLEGKSPEQKEIILRRQAEIGLPLPEGRTPSEKILIAKVKATTKPISAVAIPSEKLRKAKAAGLITPLEGKTPEQKEKNLRGLAQLGLPLPEGQTPSEKEIIERVKATTKPPSMFTVPSEKLRKAKAAGFITPLEGKSPEKKEKLLRGLAMHGIPLPEGTTPSEKKIIGKVLNDLGLPPEPKTALEKAKYNKALAEGLITPLEGKSPTQKEDILRRQAEMGLPLPEGRTPSEKELIGKVKATSKPLPLIAAPSEKLRKAKAAGFLTPLEEKTAKQKEKILRGLATYGIPLPEGKSPTEKKLIDKVRKDLGLPPEPKTPSAKEKYNKAMANGIITPLEGKSEAQKEKILKRQAGLGLPLPEGRTPSERALINKIRAEVPKSRLEEIRKAKAAGLLTPLEGKTPEQKENILRSLAKSGIPLPEAKSPSEKELLRKIREEVGLPPEPKTPSMKEKFKKAQASGIITPLEGKTPTEKEIILKRMHDAGFPLPEGRTSSEKSIVRKVRAGLIALSNVKVPSAKLRATKAAGFLTPLEGKTSAQKENILRSLAKSGIPLPDGKTPSEKELIKKVRKSMGLPPEPKSPSIRDRMHKAQAAGIITPLEGKSAAQKEKILKNMAEAGVPLPVGRTPSEKAIINKILDEMGMIPSTRHLPSEKLRQAKDAGLLTPLEGKSPEQKEKIIRGLAEAALSLPEGKPLSEKSLIHKIRTELGIPPKTRTPSEREVVRKAKAEGLLTPLTGKAPEQKEKILRGLAKAGLPMPIGKTASEKELIKRIRAEKGLPPKPTPSEKGGKIKTKSKKVGVGSAKKSTKKVAGIEEEFQDIVKTTKCDRACGCDKKKIRFKHSYVKIRVTSPDISSLCPCPNECIPGIKKGVFTDNEGIKVTVGQVIGIPPYSLVSNKNNYEPRTMKNKQISKHTLLSKQSSFEYSSYKVTSEHSLKNIFVFHNRDDSDYAIDSGDFDKYVTDNLYSYLYGDETLMKLKGIAFTDEPVSYYHNKYSRFSTESNSETVLSSDNSENRICSSISFSNSSFESAIIIRTESSLSFNSSSYLSSNDQTLSVITFVDSSFSSGSHYLLTENSTYESDSNDITEGSEYYSSYINYNGNNTSEYCISSEFDDDLTNKYKNSRNDVFNKDILIFRFLKEEIKKKKIDDSVIVVSDQYNYDKDIINMVEDMLLENIFSNTSSIFIFISGDNSDNTLNEDLSPICIQMSENFSKRNNVINKGKNAIKASKGTQGLKLSAKGRKYLVQNIPPRLHINKTVSHPRKAATKEKGEFKRQLKEQRCQTLELKEPSKQGIYRVVSMDTTQDRPCCCQQKVPQTVETNDIRTDGSVATELITPMMTIQGIAQGLNREAYLDSNKNSKYQIRVRKHHQPFLAKKPSYQMKHTPVRLCRIPSCSGHISCHQPDFKEMPPSHGCGQSCKCSPEKLKIMLQNIRKEMTTIGCGDSNDSLKRNLPTSPPIKVTIDSIQGNKYDRAKIADGKTKRYQCNSAEKKVTLKPPCPCEMYEPPPSVKLTAQTEGGNSKKTAECICSQEDETKRKRRRKKNVICECPMQEAPLQTKELQGLEDLPQYDDFEWIDKKEIIKMKSDLTQTMSGFKLDFKPRPLPESQMSFEEALQYYAEHPTEADLAKRVRTTDNGIVCECPYDPLADTVSTVALGIEESENWEEGPLKGLKFHIGGKGSGSKGLSGICCFDMVQQPVGPQRLSSAHSV